MTESEPARQRLIDVQPIDATTARASRYDGVWTELVRWISVGILKLAGWRVRGDWPGLDKAVLVAAPHTSNWDGLNMLAAAGFYRVRLRWMGKRSLVQGPFGGLMRALGCIPVDRSANHDLVRSMAEAFGAERRLILAVPPEGTRSAVRDWRSGFYHIAVGAGVPLILSVLDYRAKTISLAAVVTPSGDYSADLAVIRAHYRDAVGKHPAQFIAD